MLRILLFLFSFVVLVLFCNKFSSKDEFIFEILLFSLGALLTYGFRFLPHLKLHFLTTFSRKRGSKIRVTFAYLIKIAVKDEFSESKYLLVRNSNFDAFQPPGGVYKIHDKFYLEGLDAKDDSNFHKEGDLRLLTKRKNLPHILDKFNSKKGRELSIEREFHEELIETEILNRESFPYLDYSFIRTDISSIGYSRHFQCDEIKIFDVFEVNLNAAQKEIVASLINKDSHKFILVGEDAISRQLYRKTKGSIENRITDTSSLILKPAL